MPSRIVLVPLGSFTNAKSRLSPVLTVDQRQRLAEQCALRVVEFAGSDRTLVVCDDPGVAEWAQQQRVRTLTVSSVGLNASLQEALPIIAAKFDPADVVIVHGDLAFPAGLSTLDHLAPIGDEHSGRAFIIPDRHGTGTNVLGLGADLLNRWCFTYGPDSFQSHCALARTLSATLEIIRQTDLGFDIDTPEDLLNQRVCAIVETLLPDWTTHEQ